MSCGHQVLLVLKSLADDAKPIICLSYIYVFFSAVGQCFIVLKETGTTI